LEFHIALAVDAVKTSYEIKERPIEKECQKEPLRSGWWNA
jgi:hypothetical protein